MMIARIIKGLKAAGWTAEKINNLIIYIATGEEQYKPEPENKTE